MNVVSLFVRESAFLHSHLIQCIIDYWLMHSFRLLGSIHTNKRLVEIQLMRKMLQCQTFAMFDKPELYSDIFEPVLRLETSKTINNYKADGVLQLSALYSNAIITNMVWF